MQLQSFADQFTHAGIGIVVLTYDTPALQQAFIDKFHITFPLLSDIDATSVKSLGLLNTDHVPGDSSYGIPYPGVIILDTNQRVAAKIFLEGYATRVDAGAVLDYAVKALSDS